MRRKRMHGRRKSPFKQKWLDRIQTGLSIAGTVVPIADAINAVVSGGRAVYSKRVLKDDEAAKKHRYAAGVNVAAIVPGVGEAIKGFKTGKKIKDIATKTTKITEQYKTGKKAIKDFAPKVAKGGVNEASAVVNVGATGANIEYWRGTGQQVADEFKK